jgi:hypothetical protein
MSEQNYEKMSVEELNRILDDLDNHRVSIMAQMQTISAIRNRKVTEENEALWKEGLAIMDEARQIRAQKVKAGVAHVGSKVKI